MLQMLLNQFSNFVGCLSCNRRTDEQTLSTPEHVQLIWQGCPLTWVLNLCSRCLLYQSQSFGQMEFTQPLGVGLGLAVRIYNQYSHPYVWEDAQTLTQQSTIHGEDNGKTGYLLRNIDAGIREFAGTGYHVEDVQTMQTDKLQMMTSRGSCTSQSHKSITQLNCIKQSQKTR